MGELRCHANGIIYYLLLLALNAEAFRQCYKCSSQSSKWRAHQKYSTCKKKSTELP